VLLKAIEIGEKTAVTKKHLNGEPDGFAC